MDPIYIKDMYYDKINNEGALLIDNVNFTTGEYSGNADEIFELELKEGYTYKVIYDNVEYITTCYISEWGYPIIGNQVHCGFFDVGTNEPFAVGGWPSNPLVSIFTSTKNE